MSVNKKPMPPDFDDDAPDLTTPEWAARMARAKVRRGRPKAEITKISTTIRLSPEVIEYFKRDGPGWQTRIDEALRKIVGV